MKDLKKIAEINQKAFELSSGIKLLSHLAWPSDIEQEFFKSYKKRASFKPQIEYKKVDYSSQKNELVKLSKSFIANDPLEIYTKKTIDSYIASIDIAHSIGTNAFTDQSITIFGAPGDSIPGSKKNIIELAQQLVNLATDFRPPIMQESEQNIDAEQIKHYMDRRVLGVFGNQAPEIVISPQLAAKATANSKKIKLKQGAHFTNYDFKQLFYHEVMTHALTALNGEEQPILKCLGRGAPRTLKTQEGLATFSEIITGSMDINRLNRLALRILAINLALDGANFYEIFNFFIKNGQGEKESYDATYRIFRGGYPNKNIIFTKDCIYLEGLIDVHTLFRWAMKHNRLDTCHLLFCGRLSLQDIFLLESAYNYQWIAPPKFLPGWFKKIEGLAGTLSFSLLANFVRVDVADINFYKAS